MPDKKKKQVWIWDPKRNKPFGPFDEDEAVKMTETRPDHEILDSLEEVKLRLRPPNEEVASRTKPPLSGMDFAKHMARHAGVNGGMGALGGGVRGGIIGSLLGIGLNWNDPEREYTPTQLGFMAAAPPAAGELLRVGAKLTKASTPLGKILAQAGIGTGAEFAAQTTQRAAENQFEGTNQPIFQQPSMGDAFGMAMGGLLPGAAQAIKNSPFMKSRMLMGDRVKGKLPSEISEVVDDTEFRDLLKNTMGEGLRAAEFTSTPELRKFTQRMIQRDGEMKGIQERLANSDGTESAELIASSKKALEGIAREKEQYQRLMNSLSPQGKAKLQQYVSNLSMQDKLQMEADAAKEAFDNVAKMNGDSKMNEHFRNDYLRKQKDLDKFIKTTNGNAVDDILAKEALELEQKGEFAGDILDKPFGGIQRIRDKFTKERQTLGVALAGVDQALVKAKQDVDNLTLLNGKVSRFFKDADSPSKIFSKVVEAGEDQLEDVAAFFDYMQQNYKVPKEELSNAFISQIYKRGFDPTTKSLANIPGLFKEVQDLKPKLRLLYGNDKEADRAYEFINYFAEKSAEDKNLIASYGKVAATFMKFGKGGLAMIALAPLTNKIAKSETFSKAFMKWIDDGMPEQAVAKGTYLYNQMLRDSKLGGKIYRRKPDGQTEEQVP